MTFYSLWSLRSLNWTPFRYASSYENTRKWERQQIASCKRLLRDMWNKTGHKHARKSWMARLTVRGLRLGFCALCNPTCASVRLRNSKRTFQTFWAVWAAHVCFCTTPTGPFSTAPHFFFLVHAPPVPALSHRVNIKKNNVWKIRVNSVVSAFMAHSSFSPLWPFIAYCYRRNTV